MARLNQRPAHGQFALCVRNRAYAASLEVRKVYRTLPDAEGERHGMVRVIDESGEDYLYPRRFFVPIDLPVPARKCFARRRAQSR